MTPLMALTVIYVLALLPLLEADERRQRRLFGFSVAGMILTAAVSVAVEVMVWT